MAIIQLSSWKDSFIFQLLQLKENLQVDVLSSVLESEYNKTAAKMTAYKYFLDQAT